MGGGERKPKRGSTGVCLQCPSLQVPFKQTFSVFSCALRSESSSLSVILNQDPSRHTTQGPYRDTEYLIM